MALTLNKEVGLTSGLAAKPTPDTPTKRRAAGDIRAYSNASHPSNDRTTMSLISAELSTCFNR